MTPRRLPINSKEMTTCKKTNLRDKRKRKPSSDGEEQSAKRLPSSDQDKLTPSTSQSPPQAGESDKLQIRQWRNKEIFHDHDDDKGPDRVDRKVNVDPCPEYLLPWLRALAHYKSELPQHTVEIFWNCFPKMTSEKTIVSVFFRGPNSKDRASESYHFQKLPAEINVLAPVPASDVPLEWSKLIPLNPEKDQKRHQHICKLVLDQDRFERVLYWMEHKPGGTGSADELDEVESVTWDEFLSTGSNILDDETISAEAKVKALKYLFRGGEAAYRTRVAMNLQLAFAEGMTDAVGRKGIEALLEHMCGIINGDKLLVKSHSSSVDGYGTRVSLMPFKDFKSVGGGDDNADDDIDMSVLDESSSIKSPTRASATTTTSKGRKSSENAVKKDHADLTVFLRKGCQTVPLIVVEVKSHVTDELFQMQKHLLGGLQFHPEIFGLSINPLTAKIYRMRRDCSSRKISYSFRTHDFEATNVKPHQILFESDAFLSMCEDLLKVLKYGIEEYQF